MKLARAQLFVVAMSIGVAVHTTDEPVDPNGVWLFEGPGDGVAFIPQSSFQHVHKNHQNNILGWDRCNSSRVYYTNTFYDDGSPIENIAAFAVSGAWGLKIYKNCLASYDGYKGNDLNPQFDGKVFTAADGLVHHGNWGSLPIDVNGYGAYFAVAQTSTSPAQTDANMISSPHSNSIAEAISYKQGLSQQRSLVSPHNNILTFGGISKLDYVETKHTITAGQPWHGAHPAKNGRDLNISAGRHKSAGPAADFNRWLAPLGAKSLNTGLTIHGDPKQLNFMTQGTLSLTIDGTVHNCPDMRIGQGSAWWTDDWWLAGHGCQSLSFACKPGVSVVCIPKLICLCRCPQKLNPLCLVSFESGTKANHYEVEGNPKQTRDGWLQHSSGDCLTRQSSAKDASLTLMKCDFDHGAGNQRWHFDHKTGQMSTKTGLCLEMQSLQQNATLSMQPCTKCFFSQGCTHDPTKTEQLQRWYNRDTDGNDGMVYNVDGVCLDGQRVDNVPVVHMWMCKVGNVNQQWVLKSGPGAGHESVDAVGLGAKAVFV